MITSLYRFPKAAAFGKTLAKNKIYEHASPSSKIREYFVRQVEKITWSYKLSPATTNLPAGDGVQEIQVFHVALKTGDLSFDVLQTIDKAIPSPILFVLGYEGKSRYAAAYKRPNEADKNRWVLSAYFTTGWIADSQDKTALPVALTMAGLYQSMIRSLIPLPEHRGETLDGLIRRMEQLNSKTREATKLECRIQKEKQFNRQVELNRTLNKLKQQIEQLQSEHAE